MELRLQELLGPELETVEELPTVSELVDDPVVWFTYVLVSTEPSFFVLLLLWPHVLDSELSLMDDEPLD